MSCSAPPEMMGERLAGFRSEAENAHRQPPDRARDPVAIEIQRRPIGGADVARGVHRHAVDDGVEVLMPQSHSGARPRRDRRDGAAPVAANSAAMSARQRSSSAMRCAEVEGPRSSAMSSTARQKP